MEKRNKKIDFLIELSKKSKERLNKEELNESYDSSMEYGNAGPGNRSVPSIMSGQNKNVDDMDVRPVSQLDDPETLSRMNLYVSKANCKTDNPFRIIHNIYYKLMLAGLVFDNSVGNEQLPTEPTTYIFELSFHGGQYGMTTDGDFVDDHGFDSENGYVLRVDIDPTDDGMWEMEAQILSAADLEYYEDDGDDTVNFNEGSGSDSDQTLEEGRSAYAIEFSHDADIIYNIIDESDFMSEYITHTGKKMFKKVQRGRYDRRKAIKEYENAIMRCYQYINDNRDIYGPEIKHLRKEMGSSKRVTLEIASYYADVFEDDIEYGRYSPAFRGYFSNK